MERKALVALGFSAVLGVGAGCTGEIGGGDPTAPPPEPGAFVCTPGDPSPTVLPRLSREQYVASLRGLAEATIGADAAPAITDAISGALANVPEDGAADHARLDQDLTQAHVDAQYGVALAFATAMTASPERVTALVGGCAADGDPSNDPTCIDDFIRSFGERAHRRPITDAELAFYRDEVYQPAVGIDPLAVRDVVTVMVLSPWFLYRVENEGAPVEGREGLFELSPYELAARLSFHFWNEPPDQALLDAATNGDLGTDEGYAREVDRLLADPRAQATIDRFFAEWFLLDDLAPLHQSVGTPAYDAFVGADVPTPELRDRVIEDTLDLVRYTTFASDGTLEDLFLSDRSFAKTPDVAALYGGVPMWIEGTEPPTFPEGTRAGVLTRLAMLATGSPNSHPILRGRDIRERIVCEDLPAPPANAMSQAADVDESWSERTKVTAQTEQPGTSCSSCHARINPIGYTLEAYDGLGRFRTEERVYDDQTGEVLATWPLDTSATPSIVPDQDDVAADGLELSRLVVESEMPQSCFARHYFRFTFARAEDDAVDGCELEDMRVALLEGTTLKEVLRSLAMTPTFRRRKLAAD
jgi:hypothetical protein